MPAPPTLKSWRGFIPPPNYQVLPQDKVKQGTNTVFEGRSIIINFPQWLSHQSWIVGTSLILSRKSSCSMYGRCKGTPSGWHRDLFSVLGFAHSCYWFSIYPPPGLPYSGTVLYSSPAVPVPVPDHDNLPTSFNAGSRQEVFDARGREFVWSLG